MPKGSMAIIQRVTGAVLAIGLLATGGSAHPAGQGDWLAFESDGFRIFKRYGLNEGERITLTLFPTETYRPGYLLRRFYELIDEDLPRLGMVVNHFQTELTEIPGLTVITTMRRCRDHRGAKILVHYQGFYLSGMNRMWFVRTDLNDDIDLLVEHYAEELDMILGIVLEARIGGQSTVTRPGIGIRNG
ncbi:MAG: hypothetical protein ABW068_13050 [Candidatus Thiodiazotropha sp.]